MANTRDAAPPQPASPPSDVDRETSALAFFVRTNQSLKILSLGKKEAGSTEGGNIKPKELAELPHIPKSAAWSNDSQSRRNYKEFGEKFGLFW